MVASLSVPRTRRRAPTLQTRITAARGHSIRILASQLRTSPPQYQRDGVLCVAVKRARVCPGSFRFQKQPLLPGCSLFSFTPERPPHSQTLQPAPQQRPKNLRSDPAASGPFKSVRCLASVFPPPRHLFCNRISATAYSRAIHTQSNISFISNSLRRQNGCVQAPHGRCCAC